MAKLVLHIGMVKTGSSAIQASLGAARDRNFIYPQLGVEPFKRAHTDSLVQMFSSKRRRFTNKRSVFGKALNVSESDKDRIREAAAAVGNGTVILSSEGIDSYLTLDDVVRFKSFAEQLFDAVTVAAYVREPFSLVSASMWTRIKGSRLSRFDPTYRSYRRFEKYDQVFGAENVRLWKYDRSSFPGGDVVQHFCDSLGLDSVDSAKGKNPTPSRPAVSAIYRLNRVIADVEDYVGAGKRARTAITEHFRGQNWPKFRLSPDVVTPLIEANRDDIEWIEKRLGSPIRAKQEPEDSDIRSEADLLHIDPQAIAQLAALSGTLPADERRLVTQALAD